jgi:hypothetical protein
MTASGSSTIRLVVVSTVLQDLLIPSLCRVARALPADDAEEGSFYVFRRLTEEVRTKQ